MLAGGCERETLEGVFRDFLRHFFSPFRFVDTLKNQVSYVRAIVVYPVGSIVFIKYRL